MAEKMFFARGKKIHLSMTFPFIKLSDKQIFFDKTQLFFDDLYKTNKKNFFNKIVCLI